MKLYVAITDFDWFTQQTAQRPDELNFWQPSGSTQFHVLSPGEPLLFKLHSPRNFIVGGGFFSHFSQLPLSFAWDVYQQKNGASSFAEMRERVGKYIPGEVKNDPVIGCILLQQPFFFKPNEWISVPWWPKSTVRGKGLDTTEELGRDVWEAVQARMSFSPVVTDESVILQTEKYGKPQVVLPRLGQSAFRVLVAENYQRQCALSSSHILHVLDAAHIKPYTRGGTHSPVNGVLLRQDIHTLFDRGYL